MSFLFSYLDTISATKKILSSWHDRQISIEDNPGRIKALEALATRTTGNCGSAPVKRTRGSKDDLYVDVIEKKDALTKEYRDAIESQAMVEKYFNILTEEERFILDAVFIDNEDRKGINRVQERLYISKTEAYKKVNNALTRFAKMLYW